MKKASLAMMSVLLVFISVIIGIVIGRRTTKDDIVISYQTGFVSTATDSAAQSKEATVSSADLGKININTASLSQLVTLPDIGEVLAQRIIDYRTVNGPFSSVDDLTLVDGIGITRLEKIRDEITVGG